MKHLRQQEFKPRAIGFPDQHDAIERLNSRTTKLKEFQNFQLLLYIFEPAVYLMIIQNCLISTNQ